MKTKSFTQLIINEFVNRQTCFSLKKWSFPFLLLFIWIYGIEHCMAFKYNGLEYTPINDNEVKVSSSKSVSGHIIIPTVAINIDKEWDSEKEEFVQIKESYRVARIGIFAFSSNKDLIGVTIPNSVEVIEMSAFSNCTNLVKVEIPNSVKIIEDYAFYRCKNLTNIRIPNFITIIEDNVFSGCSSLISVVIPNKVTSIEGNAFYNCKSLVDVTIPSSVTSVGVNAFSECTGLKRITIPNSVTNIKGGAFSYCENLTSITLPQSVADIGQGAFYACPNISTIYCDAINPPTIDGGSSLAGNTFSNYNATLIVPQESVELYKQAPIWEYFFISPQLKVKAKRDFSGELFNGMDNIKGVTADGLSELYVYVDENGIDLTGAEVIIEADDGGEKGKVSDIKILGAPLVAKYGVIYTAPDDYPESIKSNNYNVKITIRKGEENNSNSFSAQTNLRVYRPGVLLLHGLFSSSECFAGFANYLRTDCGYEAMQIQNANYQASNDKSFDENTHEYNVVQNNAKYLYEKLMANKIVSTRYDIIGHSMGGILARKYAQEVNRNGVNRIITLDTPHSGSQLADMGMKLSNTWWLGGYALMAKYIIWEKSALEDLSTSSDAIKQLNGVAMNNAKDIPVHAICSYMENGGNNPTDYSSIKQSKWSAILDMCNFMYDWEPGKTILDNIYKEEKHDGIVAYQSQTGGLSGSSLTEETDSYKGYWGMESLAHHCNTNHWGHTYTNIGRLLYASKNSSYYAKGFNPVDLSASNPMCVPRKIDFKEPTENQFIHIEAEKEDTLRVLSVRITDSEDITANLVMADLGNNEVLSACNQENYRFQIPDTYEGTLRIFAMGRTEDNALVMDSLDVTYEREAQLCYMFFNEDHSVSMTIGQELEFSVTGGWTNGEETQLTPIYTTDKDDVLKVEGTQVRAIGEGECLLIAKYLGQTDTLAITVTASQPDAIKTAHEEKTITQFSNGMLTVSLGQEYSGLLTVDVYDITGRTCYQQRKDVNLQVGETAQFDLTMLPSQFYIAHVRTKNSTFALKFVKR